MPDQWDAVAAAVRARLLQMRELGNISALARRSGISDATWRNTLRGMPIKSPGKRVEMSDYLGWTPESIDDILAGGPPRLVTPRPAPEEPEQRLRLEDRELLEELNRNVKRLLGRESNGEPGAVDPVAGR